MPDPIIESYFYRMYSKGVTFSARLDGTAVPSVITTTYLNAFNFIAGVKSIKGPKLGRTGVVDLNELNNGNLSRVLTSPAANSPLGTTVTQEMFWYKTKAPGDKTYGPIELSLNMNSAQFGYLTRWYERDQYFPWAIRIPAIPDASVPPNTICMFFGIGGMKSLKPSIKNGQLVTVEASVQPTHGVGFISTCIPLNDLARVWQNFIGAPVCP